MPAKVTTTLVYSFLVTACLHIASAAPTSELGNSQSNSSLSASVLALTPSALITNEEPFSVNKLFLNDSVLRESDLVPSERPRVSAVSNSTVTAGATRAYDTVSNTMRTQNVSDTTTYVHNAVSGNIISNKTLVSGHGGNISDQSLNNVSSQDTVAGDAVTQSIDVSQSNDVSLSNSVFQNNDVSQSNDMSQSNDVFHSEDMSHDDDISQDSEVFSTSTEGPEEDETADKEDDQDADYEFIDERYDFDIDRDDKDTDGDSDPKIDPTTPPRSYVPESHLELDAIELPDDVIVDALFTNIESVQDQLELCEDGLQEKLRSHIRATRLLDAGLYEEFGRYTPSSIPLTSPTFSQSEGKSASNSYHDNRSDNPDNEHDEEEEEVDALGGEETNNNEEENGGTETLGEDNEDETDEKRRQDSVSEEQADKPDEDEEKDGDEDDKENETSLHDVEVTNKKGASPKPSVASKQKTRTIFLVMKRLRERFEYLKSSLIQCYVLYKQMG